MAPVKSGRFRFGLGLALGFGAFGCFRDPPPSQFPTADAALSRMHETYACSRAVTAEGKLDYFGSEGRVRGNVFYFAAVPENVRFDVVSPFGVALSTLTSDGESFNLLDVEQKQFLHGPASACNVARFTRVPVPPHALVELLRGKAPVLVHSPDQANIAWEGGRYMIRIASKHAAIQEIELEPLAQDFFRPYQEQRVRVLGVSVEQQGIDLYRAVLSDHVRSKMSAPRVDLDGLAAPIPPSGPECHAELPRRLRVEVFTSEQDVILTSKELFQNPPIAPGTFQQTPPGGVAVRYASCAR